MLNTLIIDTSHKLLVVGVVRDSTVLAYKQERMAKRQSESLIPFIQDVLSGAGMQTRDVDEIVLTSGPGSYTGLRIGMTFAKVFALTQDVKLYTVNTLLSISGMNSVFVMLDARGKRVFGGFAHEGKLSEEKIYTLEEVENLEHRKVGDLSLVGQEDTYGNVIDNILSVRNEWVYIENVDILTPTYAS